MYTKATTNEKKHSIPGVDGVWFGTGRADGSLLLRRHGKVSRKDAITDIILKRNQPAPGNSPHTLLVHTLGSSEALVLNSFSELSKLAVEGRLKVPKTSSLRAVRVPHGWASVMA
jgi:hypothetical protein